MRKITKAMNCLLAVVIGLGATAFVGCGEPKDNPNNVVINKDKTQLYVNHYYGGVGDKWLDEAIKEFEEQNADYKGVNGKVGVQVVKNNQKKDGEELFSELGNTSDEVFFTDKSKLYDMMISGYVLDISSVVTEVNSDGKTIESKLTEQQKEYYKHDGKYYALPHYESFGGITYNVNVFNEYELFFAKGGCPSEYSAYTQANNDDKASGSFTKYKYTNKEGALSAGPDGKYGTYDDGLPATYAEFFELCNHMKSDVTPLIWSGQFGKAYVGYLLSSLYADYEGDEVKLAYDFNGTATHLVKSINGNDVQFESATEINNENGYLTFKSAGYYYALKFMDGILSDTDYLSSNSNSGAHTHTQAQTDFILSEFDTRFNKDGKPIAMLVEGSYWENEARDYGVFDRLSKYGKSESDCNYAYLPVPKIDEAHIGTGYTIGEGLGNIAFISSKTAPEKVDIAKKFLQFCYTDANLQKFTKITSVKRALKYDITDMTGLTTFAKSTVELKADKNTNIVYFVSSNPMTLQNQSYFAYRWSTATCDYILDDLKSGSDAKKAFEDIQAKRSEEKWNLQFSKYFD